MREFTVPIKEAVDSIYGFSKGVNAFNLYENGKLVLSTKDDNHYVIQFDTKQLAASWLMNHFDQFDSNIVTQ